MPAASVAPGLSAVSSRAPDAGGRAQSCCLRRAIPLIALLPVLVACGNGESGETTTDDGADPVVPSSESSAMSPSGSSPSASNPQSSTGKPGDSAPTPSGPSAEATSPSSSEPSSSGAPTGRPTPSGSTSGDPSGPTGPAATGEPDGAGGAGGTGSGGNDEGGGGAGGEAGGTGGEPGGDGSGGSTGAPGGEDLPVFSFFVTSYAAIERLSGSPDGFGGDLRYGQADGLSGADQICEEIAEASMPGSAAKQWRAFLSVANGPDGEQVDAIDRIGDGPWYDRLGRVVGNSVDDLLHERPMADSEIANDLPNEDGVPNHAPDGELVDNHHVLTGSDAQGRLYGANSTCADWTSTEKSADGRPRVGFSWPAGGRQNWISGQDEGGCLKGIELGQTGGSDPNVGTVGSGGGYGGFYCFALTP